jgi:DNA primase
MDIQLLLSRVDLPALFEHTGRMPVGVQGRWLMYRCPCHADRHPSLGIAPDRRRWVCFGRCATSGDAINWLEHTLKLDFRQARDELLKLTADVGLRTAICDQALTSNRHLSSVVAAPPPTWQHCARHAIDLCEDRLWASSGARARVWLERRGIDSPTARYWRLGFNPAARRIGSLFVPRGIVIPCIERGHVWSLKVRRAAGLPKYVHVKGSQPALFGVHTLGSHTNALITEGEFDAMLAYRFTGDLSGVVTLGSASARLADTWLTELLPLARMLVAYDADAAGARGADAWSALSSRVKRAVLPDEPPVKDITDYYCAGGDIRQWLRFSIYSAFGETQRASPNSLPTLALGLGEINRRANAGADSAEGGSDACAGSA